MAFIERVIPDVSVRAKIQKISSQPFRLGRGTAISVADGQKTELPRGLCGSCNGHINGQGDVIACCSVFNAKRQPLALRFA